MAHYLNKVKLFVKNFALCKVWEFYFQKCKRFFFISKVPFLRENVALYLKKIYIPFIQGSFVASLVEIDIPESIMVLRIFLNKSSMYFHIAIGKVCGPSFVQTWIFFILKFFGPNSIEYKQSGTFKSFQRILTTLLLSSLGEGWALHLSKLEPPSCKNA